MHGGYLERLQCTAMTETEPQRLSKCVTRQFNCSRREAELLIEGGWVLVDGAVVEEPQFKVLEQTITLHPDAVAEQVEPATILLHKPAGLETGSRGLLQLISPASRAEDDASRVRPLKKHFSHLKLLLPLEDTASGLQVLTQDYRVERKLGEEGNRIEQEWIVEVAGSIVVDGLALLNQPSVKVSWQNETRLRFALKNPQPGQIANMCASVGLTVLALKRIRVGRISMAGLQPGQWRYLPAHERF